MIHDSAMKMGRLTAPHELAMTSQTWRAAL